MQVRCWGGNSTFTLPSYTWEEVAAHNTAKSAWVSYRGDVAGVANAYRYDITAWLDKHPGGKRVLLYTAGRDVTEIFQCYHPFAAEKVLEKYKIGVASTFEFPQLRQSRFFETLKNRVDSHLRNKRVDLRSPRSMVLLCSFLPVLSLLFHVIAVLLASSASNLVQRLAYPAALLAGVIQAFLGMYNLHDSSHAAITHSPVLWRAMGACWEIGQGLSFFNWIHQHFIGHHTYNGIEDLDPDLYTNKRDIRRIKTSQSWLSMYSYQWIYMLFLYSLLTIKNIIVEILFIAKANGRIRLNPMDATEKALYVGTKVGFFLLRVVWPVYMLGVGTALPLFLCTELVTGGYLATVFQLNHITVSVKTFRDMQAHKLSWAELQCVTTCDYGHGPVTNFFTGGLNHQIEHHLFPGISQALLPEIAPIVRRTCSEFGVPYNYLPTFTEAWKAHVTLLRNLGSATYTAPSSPVIAG